MTNATKPAAFYADFAGLASLKGAAHNDDPKALREAARQFESLFTQMMLKSMRQATESMPGGESMMENDQSKMYMEMFDNQLSLQLSKGRGMGLADMLVKQLTQRGLASDKPAGDKADAVTPTVAGQLAARTKRLDGSSTAPHPFLPLGAPKGGGSTIELPHKKESAPFPISNFRPSITPTVAPTTQPAQPATNEPQGAPSTQPWTPTATWQMPPPVTGIDAPNSTQSEKDTTEPSVPPVSKVIAQETPRPQPLAKDAADFVQKLWPYAQKAARELGVDAKTLIAHAALETGWGKFVPCNPDGTCSFNLFGIKATGRWAGASTAVNTIEYEEGVAVKKQASFRAYDSPADSFRDYAAFIKNSPRYAAAVGAGRDAVAFASALQDGGYATDPHYATKLASVAARMESMTPQKMPTHSLKLANNQPLSTGSSVSSGNVAIGDET